MNEDQLGLDIVYLQAKRSCLPCIVLLAALLASTPIGQAVAAPPSLAFISESEGVFTFDTGRFHGRLKVDGKYQGLYPLTDVETAADLTQPPGLFSFYRVLTRDRRYGNAARDWPTRTRRLGDGAVEVRWAATEEHPVAIAGTYRWKAPDTLDLEITVRPVRHMPDFELFISSYFTEGFLASVYLRPGKTGQPRFVQVDRAADSRRGYVMFPRDEHALRMIHDGRWAIGPSPVDWADRKWLAAALAMRRDERLGLTALMMSPPTDCFAVASPWNPSSPTAGGYRSLYLSLFGRDLPASKIARARCRLVLRRHMSDDAAVRCYKEYLKSLGR